MSASTSPDGLPASLGLSTLLWPVRAAAFWAAVVLPFCSLALVLGLVEFGQARVGLGSLLAANVAALLLGHGYRR